MVEHTLHKCFHVVVPTYKGGQIRASNYQKHAVLQVSHAAGSLLVARDPLNLADMRCWELSQLEMYSFDFFPDLRLCLLAKSSDEANLPYVHPDYIFFLSEEVMQQVIAFLESFFKTRLPELYNTIVKRAFQRQSTYGTVSTGMSFDLKKPNVKKSLSSSIADYPSSRRPIVPSYKSATPYASSNLFSEGKSDTSCLEDMANYPPPPAVGENETTTPYASSEVITTSYPGKLRATGIMGYPPMCRPAENPVEPYGSLDAIPARNSRSQSPCAQEKYKLTEEYRLPPSDVVRPGVTASKPSSDGGYVGMYPAMKPPLPRAPTLTISVEPNANDDDSDRDYENVTDLVALNSDPILHPNQRLPPKQGRSSTMPRQSPAFVMLPSDKPGLTAKPTRMKPRSASAPVNEYRTNVQLLPSNSEINNKLLSSGSQHSGARHFTDEISSRQCRRTPSPKSSPLSSPVPMLCHSPQWNSMPTPVSAKESLLGMSLPRQSRTPSPVQPLTRLPSPLPATESLVGDNSDSDDYDHAVEAVRVIGRPRSTAKQKQDRHYYGVQHASASDPKRSMTSPSQSTLKPTGRYFPCPPSNLIRPGIPASRIANPIYDDASSIAFMPPLKPNEDSDVLDYEDVIDSDSPSDSDRLGYLTLVA